MKTKRVGIDARLYSRTGVGVYIRNLLYYLSNADLENFKFYVYLLPEDIKNIEFNSDNFVFRESPYRWHSLDEQTLFLFQLYKDNLDLMHFTYFGYPVLYKRNFIATIHDTIMLDHRTGRASTRSAFYYNLKHWVFRFVFGNQLSNSKKIIVPTNAVADRLIEIYGSRYREKINVVSEGVDYRIQKEKNSLIYKNIQPKHFIYIGNFYPHKNVDRLILGFLASQATIPLVLVGPKDHFFGQIQKLIKDNDGEGRIKTISNVDTHLISELYSEAAALIHPSLAEGFCLPLLEAAYFDLPIIASNIPVFKEILGNNYISFDPYSISSICAAINEFTMSRAKKDYTGILAGRSFEKMMRKTFEIYKQCL